MADLIWKIMEQEDGVWIGRILELPGVVFRGESHGQVAEDLANYLEGWAEARGFERHAVDDDDIDGAAVRAWIAFSDGMRKAGYDPPFSHKAGFMWGYRDAMRLLAEETCTSTECGTVPCIQGVISHNGCKYDRSTEGLNLTITFKDQEDLDLFIGILKSTAWREEGLHDSPGEAFLDHELWRRYTLLHLVLEQINEQVRTK